MIRRVLFVILALCLIVPAVNAANSLSLNVESGNNYNANLGTITDNQVSITMVYNSANFDQGGFIRWRDSLTNTWDYLRNNPVIITLPANKSSIYVETATRYNAQMSGVISSSLTISYNYVDPTPEPDNTPRLEATLISSTNTSSTYEIQALPETIKFSQITTTRPGTFFGPEWGTYQPITHTIPAGQTQTFYVRYNEIAGAPATVVTIVLSLDVTAPLPQTPAITENSSEIDPANPAYNPPPIPTVTPGNPNQNPLTSGKFRPSNAAIITPFSQFTENLHTYGKLQKIISPTELRATALNGTGNVTAGLYDIIDRITGAIIFPATTTATAMNAVLNPIESMIIYCDEVLQQIINSIDTFLVNIMPLRDFFYMLIPDFVWWIMSAIIILEMVLTVMSFLYGRSITLMHLFGFYKDNSSK